MSVFHRILMTTLLCTSVHDAARVSIEKHAHEALANHSKQVGDLSECNPGYTYILDSNGACYYMDGHGTAATADDGCCSGCDPRVPYGRDEDGRCWYASLEGDGLYDTFANGECCRCNPAWTYSTDGDGKCRSDSSRNGLLDRFGKDICCHEELPVLLSESRANCPPNSVLVPKSSAAATYRFGNVFATTEQCETLTQMSPDMRKRMTEVMHRDQRERNKNDCISCVMGHPSQVSQQNAVWCRVANAAQVHEGGCFAAADNGKPTEVQVDDSCCEGD